MAAGRDQARHAQPRQRRHVDHEFRLFLVGQRQGISKDQSAFRVGITDFDGQSFSALQNVARSEGIAGDRVLHGRDEHPQPHRQLRIHDHGGETQHIGGSAHVLFIRSMPLAGLMSRPPVSKQTPLPTSVIFGSPTLPQPRSIRRGAMAPARPTAWIIGKFFSRSASPSVTAMSAVYFSPVHGRRFRGIRPHVIGRRVDKVAHQRHRAGDAAEFGFVQAVRQGQPDRLANGLAITREIIAAHQEAQNRKRCIVHRAVDMPVAFREAARELSGQKLRLAGLFLVAGPKQRTRYRSARAGRASTRPASPSKPLALAHATAAAGRPEVSRPPFGVNQIGRLCSDFRERSSTDMMLFLASKRCPAKALGFCRKFIKQADGAYRKV